MIHPPATDITFEAALRDLAGGSPRARARAAHALGDLTDHELRARAVEALLAVVRDPRHEVRLEVALSLGDLAQEAAVPGLVDLLDDGMPAVRQGAAIALGKLGFRAGFDALAEKLRGSAADLRFQAATSLVEIDAAAAFDPLVAALDDDDPEVLGAVALALGATGDARAPGHLARLLHHDHRRTQFDAAYALAQFRDARARPVLERALEDEDEAWDAICALEDLGQAAACPALAQLADRGKLELGPVRAAGAMLALDPDAAGAAAARKLLERALTARKLEIAGLAVELVARAGDEWARGCLARARTTRRGRRIAGEIDRALAEMAEPTL